jgi:hypothetical protein
MPTTRPGYVWDDANDEWVNIGQAAVVAPVSYQATAPTSPATGDIWIDSDDEVPGITSSLNYRWRRIATGGETSLSGNDSSGLPLAYNPGYEQVYLNGVLQYRGSDYVATTGNTITGLTALVANDTIEVLSFVTAPIGDTYTQAAADAKFVSKVESGTVAKVFSTKLNLTQAVYGTVNYNFYNQTYTTNSKVASKLLITFGVAYEFNTSSDTIGLAISLNGTDEFTFIDTQGPGSAPYNELPFYTFISTNSYLPGTVISNLRVYIKSLSGTVVCPRSAGTLHNFFLTVQEIAV